MAAPRYCLPGLVLFDDPEVPEAAGLSALVDEPEVLELLEVPAGPIDPEVLLLALLTSCAISKC